MTPEPVESLLPPGLRLVEARGAEIAAHAGALAGLRIAVFREWPYLYDGHPDYEAAYLRKYAQTPGAYVALVYDESLGEDSLAAVGAATALPMAGASADVAAPLLADHEPLAPWFYFGESVLAPEWRGWGLGHLFFALREAEARRQGATRACFLRVVRPAQHRQRPPGARDLDPFWSKRGYAPHPRWRASFAWPDLGDAPRAVGEPPAESAKPMEFWTRAL